jgi:hypothetical protein
MSISFTKIKFVEKTQTLELGFTKILEEGGEEKYSNVKYPYKPLKKFINVFRQTIPHLIIISENKSCVEPLNDGDNHLTAIREWLKEPEGYKEELFGFSVSEIKIIGYGDERQFSFVGKKKLSNGLFLNLETPPMKIHSEEFPYEFESDLTGIIDSLSELAIDYINGNYDKVGQMFSLFGDNVSVNVSSNNLEEDDGAFSEPGVGFKSSLDENISSKEEEHCEIEGLEKVEEKSVKKKTPSSKKKNEKIEDGSN